MKRKLTSLVLCTAMALSSVALLVSCADQKKPAATTAPTVSVTPDAYFLRKFPEGLTFTDLPEEERILSVSYTEGTNGEFTRRSLKADDIDEADVDVATKQRDARMKEQLGLELELTLTAGGIDGMEADIGNALAAGTEDWDILAAYQYFGISLAKKGYLINLANLAPDGADYIDLDAPYWGKAFNDNMSYKGAYYWITGDLALRYIGGMYCTFVNARHYNEKLMSTYGSIYDIAKEGKWTVDLMTQMAAKCYEDSGDVSGQKDEGDTFGFGWESCDVIDGLALGLGAQMTYKNPETGDVTVSVTNQRTLDVSKKIHTLTKIGNTSYMFPGTDSTNVMTAFASSKLTFTVNKLYQAEAYLTSMEDDYFILPVPKFDENQQNYITGIHDGCTIFGITYCTKKVPQCAAALEYLCAYSSKDVAPLYFEGALKGRYTRDAEAAAMIDLIHASVTTDFAIAWGNSIGNIPWLFRSGDALTLNNLKRQASAWQTAMDTLTGELAKYVNGIEDTEE